MGKIFFIFISLIPFLSFAQFINCKVQDEETKQPLYYATIYYGKQPVITFSDSLGSFFVRSEILNEKDSVKIEFIGYQTRTIARSEIIENKIFLLTKSNNSLTEVVVNNCKQYQEKEISYNAKTKLGDHFSIGPTLRYVLIGYYPNPENEIGFIKQLKFQVNSFPLLHENFEILLRIRWYLWNEDIQRPGRELTDTNIIIQAYKRGWNKINLPDNIIPFEGKGVVIGIEFLYTAALEKAFLQIKDIAERYKWMNKNSLSIGMLNCNNSNESFIRIGSNPISSFSAIERKTLKPALNFVIKKCFQ